MTTKTSVSIDHVILERLAGADKSLTFVRNNSTYEILNYSTLKGPNLELTKYIAKFRGGELLEWDETEKRILSPIFKRSSNNGDWAYIREQIVDGEPMAFCIKKINEEIVQTNEIPNYPAKAIILKLDSKEAAMGESERFLRNAQYDADF